MFDLESYLTENYETICHLVASKVPGVDVDDVVQEVCLQLTKTVHLFQGESSFDTWMTKIIRNVVVIYHRKRNRLMDRHTDLTFDGEVPRGAYYPVMYLNLEESLAFIPARYREVLVMLYWDNLSLKEIAQRLDMHYEAIRSRRRRALAFCRKNIDATIQEFGEDRDIEYEW